MVEGLFFPCVGRVFQYAPDAVDVGLGDFGDVVTPILPVEAVADFFDEFDIDIDEDENFEYDDSTVGGWTMTMLDGEASKGDSFTYKNLKITVIKAEEHRVWRVAVEKLPEEENEDE